jgi:hypothetical protein
MLRQHTLAVSLQSPPLRIVQLNLAASPRFADPDALLDAYHTLTGWSDAMAAAGGSIHVVQRFSRDALVRRGLVTYEFVADGAAGMPGAWSDFRRVVDRVARASPDVVHINGLMFPGVIGQLRHRLPDTSLVLQDHSGVVPRAGIWPLSSARAARWRRAFRQAQACSFTARALADRWYAVGLIVTTRESARHWRERFASCGSAGSIATRIHEQCSPGWRARCRTCRERTSRCSFRKARRETASSNRFPSRRLFAAG